MLVFLRKYSFWFTYTAIILAGLVLRFYNIADRVLHNDEAVNHFFLQRISQIGYFPYSHENYHGPAYFYLSWFFYVLFGDSESVLRSSAALSGLLTAGLPLMLRKYLGSTFVLLATAFLTFSSASLYYSRYAIHESTFVFVSVLLFFSAFIYFSNFRPLYLFTLALSAGLMLAIKETFIVTFFCFFWAFLPFLWIKRNELRRNLNMNLLAISLGIFMLTFLISYTGFFRWSLGVREFLHGIPQWVGRNSSDTGHFKSWGYYLSIVAGTPLLDFLSLNGKSIIARWRDVPFATEPQTLLALLVLLPAVVWECFNLFRRQVWNFGGVLCIWTAFIWFIYSVPVNYKTPWLIINLTVPALLLLAWYLSRLWHYANARLDRGILISLFTLIFILMCRSSYLMNFIYPLGENNPFAYVHSYQNVKDVADKVVKYCEGKTTCNVLVGMDAYWPLPYYFRNLNGKVFYKKDPVKEIEDPFYSVLLLNPELKLDSRIWAYNYFRLSEVQEGELWLRVN